MRQTRELVRALNAGPAASRLRITDRQLHSDSDRSGPLSKVMSACSAIVLRSVWWTPEPAAGSVVHRTSMEGDCRNQAPTHSQCVLWLRRSFPGEFEGLQAMHARLRIVERAAGRPANMLLLPEANRYAATDRLYKSGSPHPSAFSCPGP